MKNIKWISVFMAGVAAGGGIGAGALATAAPGDLIYEDGGHNVCITAPQAVCFADCAISAGVWTGARTDMISTGAYRSDECPSGFGSQTIGVNSAAPGALPTTDKGVRVIGVVE